jgi:amidase
MLGGPDSDEAVAYRWSLPAARGARLADFRLGFILDDPLCPVSSDVKEVLSEAVEALRRAGAHSEEGWPAGVDPAAQYNTYRYLRAALFASFLHDAQIEETRERAAKQDGSDETVQAQAWTDPHKHFQTASNAQMAARAAWQAFFRTHDAFLMPTAFVAAFPHDHREPRQQRQLSTSAGLRLYRDMYFWTAFASLTGLPATVAPVGFTREGLPVGVQIVGPYLEDATPIDLAGKLADAIGGFKPPKGY